MIQQSISFVCLFTYFSLIKFQTSKKNAKATILQKLKLKHEIFCYGLREVAVILFKKKL